MRKLHVLPELPPRQSVTTPSVEAQLKQILAEIISKRPLPKPAPTERVQEREIQTEQAMVDAQTDPGPDPLTNELMKRYLEIIENAKHLLSVNNIRWTRNLKIRGSDDSVILVLENIASRLLANDDVISQQLLAAEEESDRKKKKRTVGRYQEVF
jgi:hypothetical protein